MPKEGEREGENLQAAPWLENQDQGEEGGEEDLVVVVMGSTAWCSHDVAHLGCCHRQSRRAPGASLTSGPRTRTDQLSSVALAQAAPTAVTAAV